jgi:DNA uptake protein ComE-like DNA-binding protein
LRSSDLPGKEARALLTRNPALAAELRIGRPDLGRQYDDGELVDINHVPAEVIASELGITSPVAEDIVVQRTRVGDFNSVDDLVVYREAVTPHQVTVVRDRLLFTSI